MMSSSLGACLRIVILEHALTLSRPFVPAASSTEQPKHQKPR